ncbi:L-histidine N(alpha)-methyltransferase [Streptomyces radicis]|uniref:L-histidine N(Alpha)-methyltransferase n=1 Tax=Streptomyces radicis TaxID=1750517 RepID=A0A3A9W4K6_9ACTN|nr:L-histidine N(alpha)-methyltransferase [Streptomyces radicis]RKN04174.1 L-histidine N(alpha)-methyltransferase [Streptomyces radicis]RKN14496.1 L-histidine N(alpha)-methyltransferase [Streptomyces radicis]
MRITLDNRLPADHAARALRADAGTAFTERPRTLPPKWFYDAHGSVLFDRITRLPEYYLARAEKQILRAHAAEIAELTGARTLVELGSGTSEKTRVLLDALTEAGTLKLYAPVDVSDTTLEGAAESLCRDYPDLSIAATVADFETDLPLPGAGPRLVAFLGSTLGNLTPDQRAAFLARLRSVLTHEGDALLLGVDLVKEPSALIRAYDDDQGVTAAFNKNVLRVLNRELHATFDLGAFDHKAIWNAEAERVEMRLRARVSHSVEIHDLNLTAEFGRGEDILTEISAKFRREPLTEELTRAGLPPTHWWTDPQSRFALLLTTRT